MSACWDGSCKSLLRDRTQVAHCKSVSKQFFIQSCQSNSSFHLHSFCMFINCQDAVQVLEANHVSFGDCNVVGGMTLSNHLHSFPIPLCSLEESVREHKGGWWILTTSKFEELLVCWLVHSRTLECKQRSGPNSANGGLSFLPKENLPPTHSSPLHQEGEQLSLLPPFLSFWAKFSLLLQVWLVWLFPSSCSRKQQNEVQGAKVVSLEPRDKRAVLRNEKKEQQIDKLKRIQTTKARFQDLPLKSSKAGACVSISGAEECPRDNPDASPVVAPWRKW